MDSQQKLVENRRRKALNLKFQRKKFKRARLKISTLVFSVLSNLVSHKRVKSKKKQNLNIRGSKAKTISRNLNHH